MKGVGAIDDTHCMSEGEAEDFVKKGVISDFFVFSARPYTPACVVSLHPPSASPYTPRPSHLYVEGVTMSSAISADLHASPALTIFRRVLRIAKSDY